MELDPADPSQVLMTFHLKEGTWMGVGLGTSSMTSSSDMIQIESDAQMAHDMTSRGFRSPLKDNRNNLTHSWAKNEQNGYHVVTVRRALDTGDENDYVIPLDTKFDMSWAVNTSTSSISSYHSKRGSFTAYLPSPTNSQPTWDDKDGDKDEYNDIRDRFVDFFEVESARALTVALGSLAFTALAF
uniref:DOMON domain-containing protein n=1 Tax=Favella ehrenbergii TaxID=182087 RepID=A0A7S3I477_9SPIT|mmetsp:Transcript_30755/g.38054  ORF Transcript_30755/g.38054 Transcript_30755/m.38054 type:complete len:185 (+) Transcript_30755:114-668(+)